jgi:hypothetical protein
LKIVRRRNNNSVCPQHAQIIGDRRTKEIDGGVLQEFLEQLQHAIGVTYLEDQYLRRHRELKDGGTLRDRVSGELTVQAHALDRCGIEETAWIHFSTLDARRVSVMVNFISSMTT